MRGVIRANGHFSQKAFGCFWYGCLRGAERWCLQPGSHCTRGEIQFRPESHLSQTVSLECFTPGFYAHVFLLLWVNTKQRDAGRRVQERGGGVGWATRASTCQNKRRRNFSGRSRSFHKDILFAPAKKEKKKKRGVWGGCSISVWRGRKVFGSEELIAFLQGCDTPVRK